MDTALRLRIAKEKKETLSDAQIEKWLKQSEIIPKLTADFEKRPLFAIFRLLCLAEIPGTEKLPYTQQLITYLNQEVATEEGFSYTTNKEGLVPCYNALLLEAYCYLGMAASKEAQKALRWIKQYQVFERNQKTAWPHSGICKHGGCLKATPCYIGIGKTIKALLSYAAATEDSDLEVKELITVGLQYMLKHQLFKRLSNGEPISPHINENVFPPYYALSLTDLVYIAGKGNIQTHPNCQSLLELLEKKQIQTGQWKIDYLYKYQGYQGFEGRRKASEWLSNLYPLWLSL